MASCWPVSRLSIWSWSICTEPAERLPQTARMCRPTLVRIGWGSWPGGRGVAGPANAGDRGRRCARADPAGVAARGGGGGGGELARDGREGGALLDLRHQLGRALHGGVHAAQAAGVEEDLADLVLRLRGRGHQARLRRL